MPTITPSPVRSLVTVCPARLGARRVQQLIARALQLAACRRDRVGVRHLKLDRCLRDHPVGGPLRYAEARLGRLRERPHAEVVAATDAPAGVGAIALPFQREAEGIDEQLAGSAAGGR